MALPPPFLTKGLVARQAILPANQDNQNTDVAVRLIADGGRASALHRYEIRRVEGRGANTPRSGAGRRSCPRGMNMVVSAGERQKRRVTTL